MNFFIYENAQPILEEYPAPTALRMLLEKHDGEFDEHMLDCIEAAAEIELTTDNTQAIYCCYVNAVVQLREHAKQATTTFSF